MLDPTSSTLLEYFCIKFKVYRWPNNVSPHCSRLHVSCGICLFVRWVICMCVSVCVYLCRGVGGVEDGPFQLSITQTNIYVLENASLVYCLFLLLSSFSSENFI